MLIFSPGDKMYMELLEYKGTHIDTDFYDYKKEESYSEVDY